ncbi:MAG: type II secretion system protein [Planctomycetia bacterium]|nr:type II secretion system protein [Planctomycetia bacterium]
MLRLPFRTPNSALRTPRSGFTLVEMLIAVGLVVLMMTLFATIFQIATGAMSTQKGLAENDQRVRLVLTRLRNDLNGTRNDSSDRNKPYRTFLNLVPWGPDESYSNSVDRYGYFYISENNPDDDTDDVLGLTIQFPQGSPDRFFGRAAVLLPNAGNDYGSGTAYSGPYPQTGNATIDPSTAPAGPYWRNQPDFDDVLGVPNQVGDSEAAEVCYFLRRGNLYRRVLLIRNPNGITPTPKDGTPTDTLAADLSLLTYTGATGGPIRGFWNDFDYSAFNDPNTGGLRFHGGSGTNTNALAVDLGGAAGQNPYCLANPAYRFGFDCSLTGGNPSATYGLPREWIFDSTPQAWFIGRFTHGETSDFNFGYPGTLSGTGGNPMSNATTLSYSTTTGQVGYGGTAYSGPRASEDILMTNVLKFDIKIFDPAASMGPDNAPGVANVDDDGDGNTDILPNGQYDLKELGWPGSDDGDFVDVGHMGLTGFYNAYPNAATGRTAGPRNVPITMKYKFMTFPATPLDFANAQANPATSQYRYPNDYYNPGYVAGANPPTTATWANRYDTWHPKLDFDYDLPNHKSDPPPYRPFDLGPDGKPGFPGDDDNDGNVDFMPNGDIDIKELGWPGSDDRPIPLSAIQIKITFFDPASQQVREVTLVQSLLYTP